MKSAAPPTLAAGYKIEEWDKVEMAKARATRNRWQCLRLLFLFVVITAIVAGSVFIDEVASAEKVLAMGEQRAFDERMRAKVDRLTPSPPPLPNQPPTSPPLAPPLPPPRKVYQFSSIDEAREALRGGGTEHLDFSKLARGQTRRPGPLGNYKKSVKVKSALQKPEHRYIVDVYCITHPGVPLECVFK